MRVWTCAWFGVLADGSAKVLIILACERRSITELCSLICQFEGVGSWCSNWNNACIAAWEGTRARNAVKIVALGY